MIGSGDYRLTMDRATICWSVVHIIIFLLAGRILYSIYDGGLFSAWFIAFIIAVLILMVLSIPRYIHISDEELVVKCLLDSIQIKLDNIISVKKVSPRKIRWILPLFGGCGFFGYYGYFFDFKHFRRIVIYATEWRSLVEVVDIYEDHYYISCSDRDKFITELNFKIIMRESDDM